jgi:p-aminobenzoyl-glutamate transporter AbgT
MGTYVVLAFFAVQAIAWFRQSNLATVIGIEGAEVVKSLGLGSGPMLVAWTAFLVAWESLGIPLGPG